MYSYQFPYFIGIFFSFWLIGLISFLSIITSLMATQNPTFDKLSSYECGFEAFNDTQQQQDIRYFILGLLFIIFDIELMFLFPWVSCLSATGNSILIIGLDFLIELAIGYLMLWKLEIFDWH
jgi:NADH-quinone oxidoreductase subunit A